MRFYAVLFCLIPLFFPGQARGQIIVINEFMSSNSSTIQDEDGDFSDWIELYNPLPEAINLEGYYLSDDTLNPGKWQFPTVHIPSNGFIIVFASDKNRLDSLHLHTNFKIKNEGETLLLSDDQLNKVDLQQPVSLSSDISYGRFPDGGTTQLVLTSPTPGFPNVYGSTLNFSHASGVYGDSFYLFINSSSDEDSIYYTLNGNVPGSDALLLTDSVFIDFSNTDDFYISEIPTTPGSMGDYLRLWKPPVKLLQKAITIRACAIKNNQTKSKVYTATFFPDSLFGKVSQFPVVTLISDTANLYNHFNGIYIPGYYFSSNNPDWTGNYFLKTSTWERPVHISYFDTSGNLKMAQDAGMRIHGKITRHAPQKSLRLYARSEYADSFFEYPLLSQIPQERYKRIILQTTYGDQWQTMFKDQMITELVHELNLDVLRSEPVNVFLNGEYWGFHHLRDYFDSYFLELKYGINPDSVDIIENELEVEEGDTINYRQLFNYLETHDIAQQLVYDTIKNWIDIPNFIDYQITEIFFNNNDWPGSNVKFWREKKAGAKWRWLLFDLDASCFNPEFNSLEFATANVDTSWQNPPWATYLLRTMLLNENFKSDFINRFGELLNSTFKTENLLNHIYKYKATIDSVYELHFNRWNYPISYHDWEWAIDNSMVNFVEKRPCIIADQIMEYFNISEFGFSCDTIGIRDHDRSDYRIDIYPNPAKEFITVSITNSPQNNGIITIYNLYGEAIIEKMIAHTRDTSYSLVLNDLTPGIYIIQVKFDKVFFTQKIIIQ